MIFDEPAFLFFIAAGLLVYSWVPASARKHVLALLGLLWYGSWKVSWPLLLLFMAVANYSALRASRKRKTIFPVLVAADVAAWVALRLMHEPPFGISFFMLFLIAAVVDQWRGTVNATKGGFTEFLLGVAFFPLLVGGPLTPFGRLSEQMRRLGPLAVQNIADGTLIFSYGFLKKTLIATPLAGPVRELLSPGAGTGHLAYFIAGGLLSTLQAYAEFSGYCDMGRGLARCFGVKVETNFRAFYLATSPVEFWQRWNISLGRWIRDYFSLPAMLRFGRRLNQHMILFLAYVVVGLWHGISAYWVAFGIFNGALVFLSLKARSLSLPRSFVKTVDFFLVSCIFVGNGILSHLASETAPPRAYEFAPLGLVAAVATLVLVEYVQERRKEVDSFLRIPAVARLAAAALLIACFLGLLREGAFRSTNPIPPLYFRL